MKAGLSSRIKLAPKYVAISYGVVIDRVAGMIGS